MEALRETDGRKKEGEIKSRWISMKEVETPGIEGGIGCGEASRSLLGEEAGELITPCVFVCYNIHVTGPHSIFERLSDATILSFQIKY